jgi:hypothetical protein
LSGSEINLHHATFARGDPANASVAGKPERATDSDVVDFQRRITSGSEAELVVVRSTALLLIAL